VNETVACKSPLVAVPIVGGSGTVLTVLQVGTLLLYFKTWPLLPVVIFTQFEPFQYCICPAADPSGLFLQDTQPVAELYSRLLVVVLNITKPTAAVGVKTSRWVVVILGGKNPLVVELTSKMAEELAVLPSVLIPTDCAEVANVVKIASKIKIFFMIVCIVYYSNILFL
jgi:hypothetical protein